MNNRFKISVNSPVLPIFTTPNVSIVKIIMNQLNPINFKHKIAAAKLDLKFAKQL